MKGVFDVIGALCIYADEMRKAQMLESYHHGAELGNDILELMGQRSDKSKDVELERKLHDRTRMPANKTTSLLAHNFICGAQSVRSNFQQLMCNVRSHVPQMFMPGHGGAENEYY